MEDKIKQILIENSNSLFGMQIDEKLIQFQKTRKDVDGDLTIVIFPFVKLLKCSPSETGNKIGDFLIERLKHITEYNVISGFLNLDISPDYWLDCLKEIDADKRFGYSPENSKATVMVEYSSPNTNKPLHLGHLRNNFLGYSVAEILKANGHKVIKAQIINDRGIHICKSMLAWERFSPVDENGKRETPESIGLKGDKFVGKYYVEFDKRLNAEADEIIGKWSNEEFDSYPENTISEYKKLIELLQGKEGKTVGEINSKIRELAKNQTSILLDAKQMLIKWEARDPEVYLLWETMNGWVYEGFEQTYRAMGVDFDKLYYESDTFILGRELVTEGLKKGVFFKKEDGSVWIDLTDAGLDEKIVLRSDGTTVYMTQDVGTAVDRFRDYPDLEGIIYTVGNEQDYHFKVLFLILDKLGYTWAKNCFHLSYGMVELPSGKMKSREGTVVDADDLMFDVVTKAKEMTQERGHIDGMSEKEKEALYNLIGMGGLKYYLLKIDPRKSMLYDPGESIELNGNTGPFIQYTHARIKSLLKKGSKKSEFNSVKINKEEKEIIKQMVAFPEVIAEAGSTHSPALIANYTYELVKMYNHFYQSVPILKEDAIELQNMRLVLSENVAKILHQGMRLLGIDVPERM